MDTNYIATMACFVSVMNSRQLSGHAMPEDEALFYLSACAYLRQVNRLLEINMRKTVEEELRQLEKNDDEDHGAGCSASNPSPPA